MHLSSVRHRHGEPVYDPEVLEYPRHRRRIVRRRKSAMRREGSDVPERLICPKFFEDPASRSKKPERPAPERQAAERKQVVDTRAMNRPRVRLDGHGQLGTPGKAAKRRRRRPGILDVAMVVFGFVVYFTWAHAPGTEWFVSAWQSLRGLIPV